MKPFDHAEYYQTHFLSKLPPDGLARLQEPSEESLAPRLHYGATVQNCELPAKDPATGPSRFLSLMPTAIDDRLGDAREHASFTNPPFGGRGNGLAVDTGRPGITIARSSSSRFPEFWAAGGAFVASPEAHEVLRRFNVEISTLATDYTFKDGVSRDGYVLVDFVAKYHARDYLRSDVQVYVSSGSRYLRLGPKRTMREDIPAYVHVFRDQLVSDEVFVSRELAAELERLAPKQFRYYDCQADEEVQLAQQRIRKQRAPAKQAATKQAPRPEQVWKKLSPLLRRCDLAAAERLLVESLRATPDGPYHIACDLRITTSPETVAEYFNNFIAMAREKHPLAAVYCEMNGFTINPDEWFCTAFGFDVDGGRDNYDWLGSFNTGSDDNLVIEGLESLQEVFADAELLDPSDAAESQDARAFAERLVIVKFQRMLQDALPLIRQLDAPLLAAAHDWHRYLVEIRPSN